MKNKKNNKKKKESADICFAESCIINHTKLTGMQGLDGSKYWIDLHGYVHRRNENEQFIL